MDDPLKRDSCSNKNQALTTALFILCALFSSFNNYAQHKTLDHLQKSGEVNARNRQVEINEFVKINKVRGSFNSLEGNHFLLTEIRNGKPVYRMTLNAEASITTNVAGLRNGAGLGFDLQGTGMLVGIFDDGLIKDHIEFDSRIVSKEGIQEQNHATHVTGTIIATGINAAAQGMAPKAKATTFYFSDDEIKMASLATPDQTSLLFSNHSYGETTGWYKSNNVWQWTGDATISSDEDFRFGFYGERAKSLDELAYLAPYYSIVWAAGNDRADAGNGSRLADCNGGTGFDCIIPDAVAKNVITVGAVNKVLNYTGSSSVQMSFFSSWGPTDDGRIKPDVVGDGVNLFSTSATGTNTYATLSGTSMATPNVTGSLLLLQELYSRLHGGNVIKAATLKALAIHTAREAGSFQGPDYSFGWGLVDATSAAQLLRAADNNEVVVTEQRLGDGQSFNLDLHPKANQKITATIAWTDPAGTPVASVLDPSNLMLVNDLDIRITDELGNQQLPWILDPLNPAKKASRGDNFRDNVEKIEFDLPLEKKYTLSVSHKGQLVNGHQEFSLILTYKTIDITPKTYYWIGDSGDWNDLAHWSLSSGGPAAATLPTNGDKIIVDENSFDNIGDNLMNLTSDVSILSMIWLDNKNSGITFNDKTITIGKSFVIGAETFHSSGNGTIHLLNAESENGEVLIKKATLSGVNFLTDGHWNLFGEISFDQLNMNSGYLEAQSAKLFLKKLNALGTQSKELDVTKAQLTITESSDLDAVHAIIHSDSSTLIADGNVSLNWNDINFTGQLILASGTTLIKGNNRIRKATVKNNSEWNGVIQIDELDAQSNAQFTLGNSTELKLTSLSKLSGLKDQPVKILSATRATISFSGHYKYCFDFLQVTNVDVKDATVNAGLNSTIAASANWQQIKCEGVLFADFTVKYDCATALAEFVDKSAGSPDRWLWNFGNNVSSVIQNPTHQFDNAGTYPVSLTVGKNGASQTYFANVTIKENSLPVNTIAVNSEAMTSLLEADKYVWFKDGVVIPDAVQRSYSYDGKDGVYVVVVYDDQCNRPSESATITGIKKDSISDILIYPNPGSETILIEAPLHEVIQRVELVDSMGKTVQTRQANGSVVQMDVQSLPVSIYFARIYTVKGEIRKRVIVTH